MCNAKSIHFLPIFSIVLSCQSISGIQTNFYMNERDLYDIDENDARNLKNKHSFLSIYAISNQGSMFFYETTYFVEVYLYSLLNNLSNKN